MYHTPGKLYEGHSFGLGPADSWVQTEGKAACGQEGREEQGGEL